MFKLLGLVLTLLGCYLGMAGVRHLVRQIYCYLFCQNSALPGCGWCVFSDAPLDMLILGAVAVLLGMVVFNLHLRKLEPRCMFRKVGAIWLMAIAAFALRMTLHTFGVASTN